MFKIHFKISIFFRVFHLLGLPLNEGPPADAPTSNDRQISPKIAGLVEEIANLSLLDVSWKVEKSFEKKSIFSEAENLQSLYVSGWNFPRLIR